MMKILEQENIRRKNTTLELGLDKPIIMQSMQSCFRDSFNLQADRIKMELAKITVSSPIPFVVHKNGIALPVITAKIGLWNILI